MEAALGLPTFLERDTNVAALGGARYGAARGCEDFVYLTVSTGFGGAIVSRGQLLRAPTGRPASSATSRSNCDGPLCGCGGTGHVEAFCSGRALARDAQAAVDTGRSPFLAHRATARGGGRRCARRGGR